ncbi:MAG: hypothetical protein LBT09_02335 [Planctomycetaceae bacterium]|jgi:hypothetical protein|nr:hypothetical protein [Planctomycetaceae bacterium]
MKANILKRVVRAIAESYKTILNRLAWEVVDLDHNCGRTKLANQLEATSKNLLFVQNQ